MCNNWDGWDKVCNNWDGGWDKAQPCLCSGSCCTQRRFQTSTLSLTGYWTHCFAWHEVLLWREVPAPRGQVFVSQLCGGRHLNKSKFMMIQSLHGDKNEPLFWTLSVAKSKTQGLVEGIMSCIRGEVDTDVLQGSQHLTEFWVSRNLILAEALSIRSKSHNWRTARYCQNLRENMQSQLH